jgi:hypothetical protein
LGKEVGRWIWCKKCVHMYLNAKMIPVQESVGNEIKEKRERGWIHVWHNWYIVRTCMNATAYPHPAQQRKKGYSGTRILFLSGCALNFSLRVTSLNFWNLFSQIWRVNMTILEFLCYNSANFP